MKHLGFISQELPTECGVACIAMLGNISLEIARRDVNFSNASNSRTTQKELRNALKKNGKTLSRKIAYIDSKTLKSLQAVLLVAVNFKEKDDTQYWHWLVYDNTENQGRILDPVNPTSVYLGAIQNPRGFIMFMI